MKEATQKGKITFINHEKKYVIIEYEQSGKKKTVNGSVDGNVQKKLKEQSETLVCDALLDQQIFAGVGNIIKNEVCFRIKVHPENRIGWLPAKQINDLVKEARNYSFDFLEWKKQFVLKKHWLVHTKKICKRCNIPLIKKYAGKTKRRTFFCTNCQVLYTVD